MADLELAIQQFQEALEATPKDHPERAYRLRSLGIGYRDRYRRTGAETDLELAIQQFQEALKATPKDHPERARWLRSLGAGYHDRYQRTGAETDLKLAIQQYQKALEATPKDHPERVYWLQSLGAGYHDRYLRTGAETDLELAIQQYQEALKATPKDHPERARWLESLGAGYSDRYQRTGAETDLELAIQQFQEALEATPKDHPERARRLQSLGAGYHDRYLRIGAETDLELAIQQFQEALEATPKDHPERARRLQSLGAGYSNRYQRTGAETDLELAIQQYQEALKATPKDHPERASRLRSLGGGYHDRYRRTRAETDLVLAIQQVQEALEATPKDHPERASRLESLGIGYSNRYQRTGAETDLELAIQQFQEALKATPKDHPERASRLRSLGGGYHDRYQRTGAEIDLELAIQQFQEALKATPKDHPEQASRLESLGIGYYDRYQRTRAETDLELAIQQFQEALRHSPSPVLDRLRPGSRLLVLQTKAKQWLLAYHTANTTVSLIALLTPRSLENSDKQRLLTEVSGLASSAAAVALMADKTPYEAMRLLGLGRGLILGSLNEMRADISDLLQKHPQLAEQYIKLRNQLNIPRRQVGQFDTPTVETRQGNQRYDAGQKLERLIGTIRSLPDFDRFLMAPTEDELKGAAASGPIVTINVSDYRCDALIIKTHGLRSVPLPHLNMSDIETYTAALVKPDSLDTQLLEWLWDTVAKPVLESLGFTQKPDGCWPRIWWIPTGPLARFPIHAAGYHSSGPNTVLDRVISSYSSSIRALVESRRKNSTEGTIRVPEKAVLVGMPKTPGSKELPFVRQEIDQLRALCSSMQLQVTDPQPCRADVMAALNDCDIFHFAGHGLTDELDPSESSLLLRDGPLTVASLFETSLQSRMPFLAYLSACGTGQVKHDRLIDESLHLIAAYQMAGFRHVIGTLWEVNDRSCVEAAAMTYQWVQSRNMTEESVSEGLHRASMRLRDLWISDNTARAANRMAAIHNKEVSTIMEQARSSQGNVRDPRNAELCEDAPLYWVPYVHFGI
ncbi:CHAT domain-containing protein [Cladorrhinum sp. PSN332]|nr:CHAT domain-containing protein [Cladorrhinum sp. PSN332]